MVHSKSILYWIIFSISILGGCKDKCHDSSNPDCDNYDPCQGKTQTNATFIIEENIGGLWVEGDTISGDLPVRFTATADADSFIWTLGAETIYTKSFIRTDFPRGQYININLIVVNKNPALNCFPKDNGRDTFDRTFFTWYYMQWYDKNNPGNPVDTKYFPVYGGYYGYNESKPEIRFFVRLLDTFMTVPPCIGTNTNPRDVTNHIVEGIPFIGISTLSHCLTSIGHIKVFSPKGLYINYYTSASGSDMSGRPYQFPGIKAHAVLTRDLKNITIDYEWQDTTNYTTWYKDKFIGKKLW